MLDKNNVCSAQQRRANTIKVTPPGPRFVRVGDIERVSINDSRNVFGTRGGEVTAEWATDRAKVKRPTGGSAAEEGVRPTLQRRRDAEGYAGKAAMRANRGLSAG
jgi:hypothetical protein